MESIIRNVKDIEANDRRSLEHIVGQQLRDNQEVLIQVIDLDLVATEQSRLQALARAAEIARHGRANAAASGATAEEVDADIEQATAEVRCNDNLLAQIALMRSPERWPNRPWLPLWQEQERDGMRAAALMHEFHPCHVFDASLADVGESITCKEDLLARNSVQFADEAAIYEAGWRIQ